LFSESTLRLSLGKNIKCIKREVDRDPCRTRYIYWLKTSPGSILQVVVQNGHFGVIFPPAPESINTISLKGKSVLHQQRVFKK